MRERRSRIHVTDVQPARAAWVGRDEHFRYVVQLEPRPLSSLPFEDPPPEIPSDGLALDAWIAASGRNIDMILWER